LVEFSTNGVHWLNFNQWRPNSTNGAAARQGSVKRAGDRTATKLEALRLFLTKKHSHRPGSQSLVLVGLRFRFSPLVEFQPLAWNSTNGDGALRARGKLASESRSLSAVFPVVGFGIYFPSPERRRRRGRAATFPELVYHEWIFQLMAPIS
jgi:hypothetical protein